jgi:CrcB protein
VPARSELQTTGAIAAGGALGATGRWAIAEELLSDVPDGFPWAIFTVNVLGCLLIGVVSSRVDRGSLTWAFVATGVLGGFTTMSSFAVELNELAGDDSTGAAVVYALATLVAGFVALAIGDAIRGPIDDAGLGTEGIE